MNTDNNKKYRKEKKRKKKSKLFSFHTRRMGGKDRDDGWRGSEIYSTLTCSLFFHPSRLPPSHKSFVRHRLHSKIHDPVGFGGLVDADVPISLFHTSVEK